MRQRVRVLRDMPVLELVGRQLGPLVAGDEVDLWTWEAVVLERHGIASRVQKSTVAELRKFILAEERSPELVPLPEDFYFTVARDISTLHASGDLEKADELRARTLTLMDIRLPKLIRLALSSEALSGLPIGEHFMVNRLATVLESWSQWLSELLEKAGEEVEKNELGGPIQHAAGDQADIQKSRVPAPELHARGTAA